MVNNVSLEDKFIRTGNNFEDFKDIVNKIMEATYFQEIKLNDVELLTYNDKRSTEDYFSFYANCASDPRDVGAIEWLTKIRKSSMKNKNVSEELMKELCNSSKVMLKIGEQLFFTSHEFIPTLALRVGICGQKVSQPSPKRDEYIIEALSEKKSNGTLMYRQIGDVKKAFTMHSDKYVNIPQNTLIDIIQDLEGVMGKAKCLYWNVDQNITYIYLKFPEKAKDVASTYGLPNEVVPGVYIATSDTGDCSITANSVWSIDGAIVRDNSIKKRHIGELNLDDLKNNIKDNIFAKYTVLPDRLSELLLIDIDEVNEVYKYIFKKVGIAKAIGRKQATALLKCLCDEINPREKYTAYNIAITIMSLPTRVKGINHYMEELLQNAVYNAAFVDYSQFEVKTSIYLTA